MSGRPLLSVVTPAFNEGRNLQPFYQRLSAACDGLDMDWEWVVVDDHSTDDCFQVVQSLAARDARVRGVRFSRNFGSHAALACGLREARGQCAILMASDLQDPPETIPQLLEHWRQGSQVVWAVRAAREGEALSTRGFSRLYYALIRRTVALRQVPATGADFGLLDRVAIDALNQTNERNSSLLMLLMWMGFRQSHILYVKQSRLYGQSGWSFAKKFKLVIDTLTSFTYFPIRMMSYGGAAIALLGFLYALVVVVNAFIGSPVAGYPSLMVAVLVLGGIQMLMLGVLGEYLWRALDEARQRPRYIIEDYAGRPPP